MTTQRKFQAWALQAYGSDLVPKYDDDRERFLAGVYHFDAAPPDCVDGNRTALFRTREKARQAARRQSYVKFRVVRVSVEVKVI